MKEHQLAKALGWFSIGLGLAELLAPRKVSKAIGVNNHTAILRIFGLREIASGVGILTQRQPTTWMWSRVAGDLVDLGALGAAMGENHAKRNRILAAAAAVAGVTVADILCSRQLSQNGNGHPRPQRPPNKVVNVITINRPAEQLFSFWRNFENLPRVMPHLKAVAVRDSKHSHWVAKGPGDTKVEWDAEIINEHPNELIAWRSLPGSQVDMAGTVRFQPAPAGRGTIVKVDLSYSPPGGIVGAKIAKLFGEAPEQQIANDLKRFKQLMETGEVATIEGQPSGRRTSTSKRYDQVLPDLVAS